MNLETEGDPQRREIDEDILIHNVKWNGFNEIDSHDFWDNWNLKYEKMQKMMVVHIGHETTYTYCLINYIQPCCYCNEPYPFITNVIK